MKKIFSIHYSNKNIDLAILMTRVVIATLMMVHGIPKLTMLFSGDIQFPPVFGLSAGVSLSLAVFAELFCSLFIMIGLGTRAATIPLIITMLVALFYIHIADPFAKQELSIHYLLVYSILLITGSGKYSLDYLWHRKLKKADYSPAMVQESTASL